MKNNESIFTLGDYLTTCIEYLHELLYDTESITFETEDEQNLMKLSFIFKGDTEKADKLIDKMETINKGLMAFHDGLTRKMLLDERFIKLLQDLDKIVLRKNNE